MTRTSHDPIGAASLLAMTTLLAMAASGLACTTSHAPLGDGGPIDAGCASMGCAPPPEGCWVLETTPCECGEYVCEDAGLVCDPCPAPGPGCHYESVDACGCGFLVCDSDGGTSCPAPCPLPPPPEGCEYVSGASSACCDFELRCGAVDCSSSGAGGWASPALDKSCTLASECVIVYHQLDCCGSELALGINAAAQPRAEILEAECRAMYPGCGCAAGPITAEDGNTGLPGDFAPSCEGGQCRSVLQI
ncbi:MAG: hypothetical protein OEY14_00080 [Myxococcales bacterium]|nr:hypothetical protein [Myxococcales bacterium]